MVNGLIISKFDEEKNFIQNIFKECFDKYFNKSVNSIEVNKKIEDKTNFKIINTIKDLQTHKICSICELKDKRLVSCSNDKSIIVYDKSYKPQFKIKNAHTNFILSLCVLKNGELVSSGDEKVKVWRINVNDYQLIHILIGHADIVYKVIELKDGRISSCSSDQTIIIWDNYKCIHTLKGHTDYAISIIEMNNCIISASGENDKTLRVWDESTYNCIKIINDVYCYYWNALSKMNNNTLLVGGKHMIYVVNIQTYKVNKIEDKSLDWICCINVLKNGLIIFGNKTGEICCADISSDKIFFRKKFHNSQVYCLIESEDKLISCSCDKTINIYKEV